MKLRSLAARFVPETLKDLYRNQKQASELERFYGLDRLECHTENLLNVDELNLEKLFNSKKSQQIWDASKDEIDQFSIPDATGGVNPGDRRAINYLIGYLKPKNTLEIGTHIGASTLYIASALYHSMSKNQQTPHLATLDIRDVNSTFEKPWLQYGSRFSPLEMLKQLDFDQFVTFITDKSLTYLRTTSQKFDFIFLDGNHTASMVYQEIPAALKLLNNNGVILLHDYYPGNQPLWSNDHVIKGPYLAVERLIEEGADITVLPLGDLPWETKLNSHTTSLALLMRRE
jgi:predicted O-methyltransferase YrrM